MSQTTRPVPGNAPILGTLNLPGGPDETRVCIPTRELHPGDTLHATGFRHGGGRRYVYDTHQTPTGAWYIHTRDGWYRWYRVYCLVNTY